MNQPSIACGSWLNDLSHLHFECCAPAAPNGTEAYPYSEFQDFPAPDQYKNDGIDSMDGFGAHEDSAHGQVDEYPDHTATPVIDNHPNIPSIYPGGTMFADQFSNDPHATYRTENLYYPFASSIDWQLVSWLLRSHLSMAAIDKFLSLHLVR